MTELEKFADTQDRNHELRKFIMWLEEQNLEICRLEDCDAGVSRVPTMESSKRLVARYLGVDLKKLDQERRALLDEQRQLNEAEAKV